MWQINIRWALHTQKRATRNMRYKVWRLQRNLTK